MKTDSQKTKDERDGIGMDDDPTGEELTPQEAVDEIAAMYRRGQRECFPDNPDKNFRNAGRVRALAQALALLERAGMEPNEVL